MPLAFGLTVVPDPPYQRLIEVRTLGEQHGFEYGWTHDSQGADKGSEPRIESRSACDADMPDEGDAIGARAPEPATGLHATGLGPWRYRFRVWLSRMSGCRPAGLRPFRDGPALCRV
jgi:hypothetical protein